MTKTKSENNLKPKKGIFKYVTLKTLIILVVLLMFNSYAWFIFATKVSANLTVHVSSWNVVFKVGDTETSTNMIIDVGKIYPGMADFQKVITVYNSGETRAILSYQYKKIILLGVTYEVGDQYTSTQIQNKIENDYPFKTNIAIDQTNFNQVNGTGTFTINVSWPYESGNDTYDTYWGEQAYDYYQNNGDASSLHIELELIAQEAQP